MIELPPPLILPETFQAKRPAIIRHEVDPARYFPAEVTRLERRAIVAELRRTGRVLAMLPGMVPVITRTPLSAVAATLGGTAFNATGESSTTFTALTYGAAAASGRYVAALFGADSTAGQPSSVIIGGIYAAPLSRADNGGSDIAEIWIAPVPTGTSGNVVIAWNGSGATRKACTLVSLTGLLSATAANTATSTATPSLLTIDCPAGGIILATAHWSTGSANVRHSDAYDVFASAQTNLAVSVAYGSGAATWSNLTKATDYSTGSSVSGARRAACAVSLR